MRRAQLCSFHPSQLVHELGRNAKSKQILVSAHLGLYLLLGVSRLTYFINGKGIPNNSLLFIQVFNLGAKTV
jgi:hypothetical protein